MADLGPSPSRRALLGALTTAPIATTTLISSPWASALASLHDEYGDPLATLARTREGRELSHHRYQTAEDFFPEGYPRTKAGWRDHLYFAGITAQLALASHLLDVGFDEEWCAANIGYRVAKSLAYANATGFGHSDPEMAHLAEILTPYWRWNAVSALHWPDLPDGGFTPDRVSVLLRALLDHVGQVTGHRGLEGPGHRTAREGDA